MIAVEEERLGTGEVALVVVAVSRSDPGPGVSGLEVEEGEEECDGRGDWLASIRSSKPPMIVRERGAGLASGAYCGRRGAEVMRLIRTFTSRFGWTMVSLMLNGAIS